MDFNYLWDWKVYVLGRKQKYTILKHTHALLIGIKEVLKVNTEKPRYMLMLCEQNNNINTANKPSENLAKFIYWGMIK